jgi:hypothetical protein
MGFAVEGIATDRDPGDIREDLLKPRLEMVSLLDRMRKGADL